MPDGPTAGEQADERLAQADAEFYSAHGPKAGEADAQAAEIVRLALEWAQPAGAERALDLGCGLGRMTAALTDRFDAAIGCDANAAMLAQAAARLGEQTITWAPIVDGRVPADDRSCDFVLCYEALPHLADPATVEGYVREIARILRPDGCAVLQFDTQRPRGMAARLPAATLARPQRRFRRRYPLAADEPTAMATRAGLRTVAELQAGTRFHQLLVAPA